MNKKMKKQVVAAMALVAMGLGAMPAMAGDESGISTNYGLNSVATANYAATAFGAYANATNAYATALGANATASGVGSVSVSSTYSYYDAQGNLKSVGSIANGIYSVAMGAGAVASYTNEADNTEGNLSGFTVAIGANSYAKGDGSVAFGYSAISTGNDGIAIGDYSSVAAKEGMAIGSEAASLSAGASSVGSLSAAGGTCSGAFGYGAKTGYYENTGTEADPVYKYKSGGNYSYAIGYQSLASGDYSLAVGTSAVAGPEKDDSTSVQAATAIGHASSAFKTAATALGYGSGAWGEASTAVGSGSLAQGDASFALGASSLANGKYSLALGTNAVANTDAEELDSNGKETTEEGKVVKRIAEVSFGHSKGDSYITQNSQGQVETKEYDYESLGRLTHVADGQDLTDAAAYGQLIYNDTYAAAYDSTSKAWLVKVKTNTDAQSNDNEVNGLTLDLSALSYTSGNEYLTIDDAARTITFNSSKLDDAIAGKVTTYTAGDHISIDSNNKISVDASGTVTAGNDKIVTGDSVYQAMVKEDTYKLNDDGKTITVSRNDGTDAFVLDLDGLAGGTGAKYTAGDNVEISDDNVISVKADGKVEAGNEGIVTGGEVYDHLSGMKSDLEGQINKVGAGAAALAMLHPEGFDPTNKWNFAVGYGHYKNANAGALGAFYKPNADTTVSVASTMGNGNPMFGAGVSFKIGQRGNALPANTSNAELVREVNNLRADNEQLKKDKADQAREINDLKAKIDMIMQKMNMSSHVNHRA